MVNREVRGRYSGSVFGSAWAILNPLAMIAVYTLVFSQVMRARLPDVDDSLAYGIFLCTGIFAWTLFAETLTRTVTIFVDNANLIKKSNFPRITLPLIVSLTGLVNYAIVMGLFGLFLAVTGRMPGWSVLAFIPLLAIQVMFAAGLGIFLGVLNVFFRDVQQVTSIVVQFWFWLTPIVYPIVILPEYAVNLLTTFNPMAEIMLAYQDVVLRGEWPVWSSFLDQVLLAAASVVIGWWSFRKLVWEMVDEL